MLRIDSHHLATAFDPNEVAAVRRVWSGDTNDGKRIYLWQVTLRSGHNIEIRIEPHESLLDLLGDLETYAREH
jgi:hypothetical protein